MPTLANQLVQFLMSLFNNPVAAQDFLNDPEKALDDAGLGGVCSADVDAAMPVVLDYAPITVNASSFDREYNTGGNTAWTGHNGGSGGAGNHDPGHGGDHGGGHHDDHAHAVQQLHHVVNNYSYTSTVDDRDTITDQSVNQNIWAHGDVRQFFDNDAIIASGDQAMAAGDDIDVEDSFNVKDSYNTDNSVDNSKDNSIHAGDDVNIGNTDIDVDVDDSFNTDKSIEDSYNTEIEIDAELENVGNTDNSQTTTIVDSYNDDHSKETEIEIDAELENVGNTYVDKSVDTTNVDKSVDVDAHLNNVGNTTTTNTNIEDNVVVADNTVDYTNVEDNTVVADNEFEYTEIDDITVIKDNELEIENNTAVDHSEAG